MNAESTNRRNDTIAFFVTPHGYGHAARACAVMESLRMRDETVRFEIFSRVPQWFFLDSISGELGYHETLTDIGLVQRTPLHEDIPATLERLVSFMPFQPDVVKSLAQTLHQMKTSLVVCDISPLGIVVAQEAGIPSVLIENFTWDWIYRGYLDTEPRLRLFAEFLTEIYTSAVYHIATEPVCNRFQADVITPPVSRSPRTSSKKVREQLNIPAQAKMILITMGGVPSNHDFTQHLRKRDDVFFVIPGGAQRRKKTRNVLLLPNHSEFYHPDLVNASDCVISKLGYSTLTETYHAGVPFGYIMRSKFREAKCLKKFIEAEMQGIQIEETAFYNGEWMDELDELISMPRISPHEPNGATPTAAFLLSLLKI